MTYEQQKKQRTAEHLLTSKEVMELTGANRRMLVSIEERGLCSPVHLEGKRDTLGWSYSQMQTIKRIQSLRDLGVPFETIEQRMKESGIEEMSDALIMEVSRKQRRALKQTTVSASRVADAASAEGEDEFYLRYIPQRWLAIVRCGENHLPGSSGYTKARTLLQTLANHVGWCSIDSGGSITSTDGSTNLVFCFLTSQPLPLPLPGYSADGGCYHDFGGDCAFDDKQSARQCALCPRHGNAADNGMRLRWTAFCDEIGAVPLQQGFPSKTRAEKGPWCEFTKRSTMEDFLERRKKGNWLIAGRPCSMPLETELPTGVTGAVLPAGVYLCKHAQGNEHGEVLSELRTLIKTMKRKDLTPETAASIRTHIESQMIEDDRLARLEHNDECISPLSGPPFAGDIYWQGWSHGIDASTIHSLTSFSSAGIFEEDTDIIVADLPGHDGYEIQTLIDIDALPANLKPKAKKHKPLHMFALGAVPGVSKRLDKRSLATTMCRVCGKSFECDANLEVPCCTECGAAKPIANVKGKHLKALLEEIENELLSRNFKQAQKLVAVALKRDDQIADAHWLSVLSRYGVYWMFDTVSGVYKPHLEYPDNGPLLENQDCCNAITLASNVQWAVYSNMANAIEFARQEQLRAQSDAFKN